MLSKDSRAVRVCLLATQAGPLAGDHDRVTIGVGAGATLVVSSVGAAYVLPGRSPTLLELDIELGAGSRIAFEDAPLIVARNADVTRSTTVRLGTGAVAALRDVVVLGDEGCGATGVRLASTLRVTDPAGVLLHDELRIDPARDDAHVALAPGHRVVGTLCLFGEPPEGDDPAALRAGPRRHAAACDRAGAGGRPRRARGHLVAVERHRRRSTSTA